MNNPIPPDINPDRIVAELQQSGVFRGKLLLVPIEGGVVNRSFLLRDEQHEYFLKTFEQAESFNQDRLSQYNLQKALAERNRAPVPVYLAQQHDFQVDRWICHVTLSASDITRSEKVKRLATVLVDIHQIEVEGLDLNLPAAWQHYRSVLSAEEARRYDKRVEACMPVWHASLADGRVLCHNDLALQHLDDGKTGIVFDWEYAAYGNPYYDLASCMEVNGLSDQECAKLMEVYARLTKKPLDWVIAQCELNKPLVKLTNELWFAAARQDGNFVAK